MEATQRTTIAIKVIYTYTTVQTDRGIGELWIHVCVLQSYVY